VIGVIEVTEVLEAVTEDPTWTISSVISATDTATTPGIAVKGAADIWMT